MEGGILCSRTMGKYVLLTISVVEREDDSSGVKATLCCCGFVR